MLLEKVKNWGFRLSLNIFLKENSFVSLTMPMNNGTLDGNTMRQVISCQRRNFCQSVIFVIIFLPKNVNERVRDACRYIFKSCLIFHTPMKNLGFDVLS